LDDMNAVERFKERVKETKLSLFLDYDGTLTPIVGRPERAHLSYTMKEVLRRLKKRYPLAVISGRSLDDLMERVGIPDLVYAGNHGLEIESEEFSYRVERAQELRETIAAIAAILDTRLKSFRGAIVEYKGLTLSIHYRLVDVHEVSRLMEVVKSILAPYKERGRVKVKEGKKVIEVRPPVEWDKGTATTWILDRGAFRDTLPIYIGDDETDRDAFKALKNRGLSIVVGHKWKEADYFLEDQSEVKGLLTWLASC